MTYGENMPSTSRRPLHISILSYNRPEYLSTTLQSLAPQLVEGDRVYLFQDGGWSRKNRCWKTDRARLDRCVRLFEAIIPGQSIFSSHVNLGIAGNYQRAEEHLFEAIGAEAGLFLEDDLILSPNYLSTVDQLLTFATSDDRIGYVSAYGDFWAALNHQESHSCELIPMHENWGAALTRSSWLKQRVIRNAYWDLVRDSDYSTRDVEAIKGFYASIGYPNMTITSQDGARWVACAEAGLVRITTATCHALYIGEIGEHSNRDFYRRCRFAEARLYPAEPVLSPPEADAMNAWLTEERRNLHEGYRHSYQKALV